MRRLLPALALLTAACTGDQYTVQGPRTVEVGQTFRIRVYDNCNEGNLFSPMGTSGDVTCVKDDIDIKSVLMRPRDRLRVKRFVNNDTTRAAVEFEALRPGRVTVRIRGKLGLGEYHDSATLDVVKAR